MQTRMLEVEIPVDEYGRATVALCDEYSEYTTDRPEVEKARAYVETVRETSHRKYILEGEGEPLHFDRDFLVIAGADADLVFEVLFEEYDLFAGTGDPVEWEVTYGIRGVWISDHDTCEVESKPLSSYVE